MKGAHCLHCRELGPELVIANSPLPMGTSGRVSFECGKCGTTWEWTVTMTHNGFMYRDPTEKDPDAT